MDINWDNYLAYWRKYEKEELPMALANYLLAAPLSPGKLNEVVSFADPGSNNGYIKSLTVLLMELPEYQLA